MARRPVTCRNCGHTTTPVSGFCPRCLDLLPVGPRLAAAPLLLGVLAALVLGAGLTAALNRTAPGAISTRQTNVPASATSPAVTTPSATTPSATTAAPSAPAAPGASTSPTAVLGVESLPSTVTDGEVMRQRVRHTHDREVRSCVRRCAARRGLELRHARPSELGCRSSSS